MVDIKQLFALRTQVYADYTLTIIQSIQSRILDSIESFIKNAANDNNSRIIKWDNVQLFNGILYIAGVVLLEPGSVIKGDEGNDITVTINNQEYFKDTVKLNFPIELAERGTKEDISNYIQELYENENPKGDGLIFIKWQARFKGVEEKTDFDYTELSVDQLKRFTPNDDGVLN